MFDPCPKKNDRSVPHEFCVQSSSLGIGRQPAKKTTPEKPDFLSRLLIALAIQRQFSWTFKSWEIRYEMLINVDIIENNSL